MLLFGCQILIYLLLCSFHQRREEKRGDGFWCLSKSEMEKSNNGAENIDKDGEREQKSCRYTCAYDGCYVARNS